MTQQTAIDYLVNLYYNEFNILLPSEYYNQAKQMENEQHSKTFEAGYNRACDLNMGRDDEPDFDQYYNETYGK